MNKYKASCCKRVRCEQVFIYHNLYCTVHGIRAVLDILLHTRTSTVVYTIQFKLLLTKSSTFTHGTLFAQNQKNSLIILRLQILTYILGNFSKYI